MRNGFVKVAAVTPRIKVADVPYNAGQICDGIKEASKMGAKIIVFPELCLTGYTCEDLFLQEILLEEARQQLMVVAESTAKTDALVFVGLPIERENKLYNAAAVLHNGKVKSFIPKSQIPNYGEFYEARHFAKGNDIPVTFEFAGEEVPFGANILFETDAIKGLVIGCEICEDVWSVNPPSTGHALAGATVIVNLSASNETVAKDEYRRELIAATSARLLAGYVYASIGEGESTGDLVFGGHNIIAENGRIIAQSERFQNEITYSELDIQKLRMERRKNNTFCPNEESDYIIVPFALEKGDTFLSRTFEKMPFVPDDKIQREKRCEEIISMQAFGLKKRYEHIGCKTAVIGISGGLDSTLALLVTARTFDMLSINRKNIYAITMPCFGTTDRTYDNACELSRILGTTLEEIDVKEAVTLHFRDIGQDCNSHDVTYENAQARERTQILMDIANRVNGLVIGTGDMSELALGWATYNGDHMSMYGVNAGVPKTLVKHLVKYYADSSDSEELKNILLDIVDTPVSPELLPPVGGTISQKTEDLVGPYELHDFFLYYMLRCGFEPQKIYRIAVESFQEVYSCEVILKWLKIFYKRFFTQQFKRSCIPDGPKVGSVSLSPRGDLRMPSDACVKIWLEQLESL